MNTRQRQNVIYTLIITSLLLTTTLLSGNALAASLKKRMQARLPQTIQLKAKGIIGENNRGFQELRHHNSTAATLISAENQDRQTVYNSIAQEQNTSPAVVGQRRAAQITARAPSGTWLQNETGEWYKK